MPKDRTLPLISLHFHQVSFSLRDRTQLKNIISAVFNKEAVPLSRADYIFCSDDYLLNINRTHLRHDHLTDIITFNLSPPSEKLCGEIYISIDRVRDNALKFGQSFRTELTRVMIHGALHLCGYKDKTGADKKLMRTKEDFYLEILN